LTQSRRHSAIEAVANVAVGYAISVVGNAVILPAFGFEVSLADNLLIGLCFTAISVVRSYALRRVFNGLTRKRS
jgi:hypothetical protein